MNPYQVLGVSETATQDEIRAAYRALVKKYHPDKYRDETLKAEATKKMQEINAAYDELTKNGGAGSGAAQDYGRGYSGGYTGEFAAEFAKVERLINSGALEEAMAILDAMNTRNARWNYLYGIICMKLNRNAAAADYFERAYAAEPYNVEYRNAYSKTHMNRYEYNNTYNKGGSDGLDCCDCCTVLSCTWCLSSMCDNSSSTLCCCC